jgi:hypothetical protein
MWGLASLAILVGAAVALLAFPHPFFRHEEVFGKFTVRSNRPIPAHFGKVIEDVRNRVAMMENARPGASCRVFICHDPRYYGVVAFLTRRTPNSMAIGLSAFDNVFLNDAKIQRMAAHNPAGIRHSRFEGNVAEVVAHEIAHFNVVDSVGYRASLRMPLWKSEGLAEYQANIAATRADRNYAFTDRIALLQDESLWGSNSIARQLYESHLLVEFLYEVKGFGLADLLDDAVNETTTRQEMLAWYADQTETMGAAGTTGSRE